MEDKSEEDSTVARRDLLILNQLPGVDMEVTKEDMVEVTVDSVEASVMDLEVSEEDTMDNYSYKSQASNLG